MAGEAVGVNAPEGVVERGGVGDDFVRGIESDFKIGSAVDGGLGGGAENDGGMVVGVEFLQGTQAGGEKLDG